MTRKRALYCAAVLASCACAFAQDLSKSITYRTVAVPLHSSLDAISKQAGVTLGVSDELADEPVIFSINGATAQDVMDHVASTVGGVWQKRSENEFLLLRTDELRQKLHEAIVGERAANIKRAIDRLAKEQNNGDSPEAYAQKTAQALASSLKMFDDSRYPTTFNDLQARYPGHRALIHLLQIIPPRELAELGPGDKVVFSTQPNSMQQELPDAAQQVLEEFENDQNLFADAFAKDHPDPITPDLRKRLAKRIAHLNEPLARLLLIVQGSNFMRGAPSAKFIAVSKDGSAVGYGREMLTVEPIGKTRATSQAILASAANEPEIPLSADSKIFVDATLAVKNRFGDPPRISDAQQAVVLGTDQHDPLSLLVSDGFLALADKNRTNLVANPTEDTFYVNFLKQETGSFKLSKFLDTVKNAGTDVQTEGNWTTASPFDIVDEDRIRINRDLLAACFRDATANGCVSIATAATLAMSQDPERGATLSWAYGTFGDRYYVYRDLPEPLLRFYSSLNDSQLGALRSGNALRAGDMTKDQWEMMQDMAYHGGLESEAAPPDEYGDSGDYALKLENTEILPDGVSNDATVSMKESESDVLFAGVKFGSGNTYINEMTIDEMASEIAAKQAGSNVGFGADVQFVSPGHAHNISFEFVFTPTVKSKGSLREVVRGDERWGLDSLPSDLNAKLKAAIVAAKARLDKDASSGQASGPLPAQPPRK